MVRTASTMLQLGTPAPDFSLVGVDGRTVQRDEFRGSRGLLVVFLCNHCPFVKHIADHFSTLAREFQASGVAVVGISSNDAAQFPADSPEQMVHEAELRGYSFPYLYDESQETALAYAAACTPDFFLFDGQFRLVYRGRYDATQPKTGELPSGDDLRRAVDALLANQGPLPTQLPSVGCNIKWKPGQEPVYFDPAGLPK